MAGLENLEVEVPFANPLTYDGLTYQGHMVAGAFAGMGEHLAMYPVDTIKTQMQALAQPGQQAHTSVTRTMASVVRQEGLYGLYRGATAMALGAGPAHALYFAAYEQAKELLGGNRAGHHPLAASAAGTIAVVVNDGFMTPWDVVKQRMQVANSPYRGLFSCIATIWRREGMQAFYKSYWTTLLMNLPYTALHFPVYESMKKAVTSDQREEEGLVVQLLAGGVAGGVAAAATTPLDVVKTRLQLEGLEAGAARYGTMSVGPVLRQIAREEGVAALWSGWTPRVLFHVPSAAVCWGIYESAKRLLAPRQ